MTANVSPATSVAARTIRFKAGWPPPSLTCTISGTFRAIATATSSVRGTSAHQFARQPNTTAV